MIQAVNPWVPEQGGRKHCIPRHWLLNCVSGSFLVTDTITCNLTLPLKVFVGQERSSPVGKGSPTRTALRYSMVGGRSVRKLGSGGGRALERGEPVEGKSGNHRAPDT